MKELRRRSEQSSQSQRYSLLSRLPHASRKDKAPNFSGRCVGLLLQKCYAGYPVRSITRRRGGRVHEAFSHSNTAFFETRGMPSVGSDQLGTQEKADARIVTGSSSRRSCRPLLRNLESREEYNPDRARERMKHRYGIRDILLICPNNHGHF